MGLAVVTPFDRALKHGADVLSLEELLSLIVDDTGMAQELATGGVGSLFRLQEHELVNRFGRETAVRISACCELVCRLQEHHLDTCHPTWYLDDVAALIHSRYGKREREAYGALVFGADGQPITHDLILRQEICGKEHEVRQIMRYTLAHGAASVLVFCYRPSKEWGSSKVLFLRDLELAASHLDLEFRDYLEVLVDGRWRSAKEERKLEGSRKRLAR